jgi:hypothetical protein
MIRMLVLILAVSHGDDCLPPSYAAMRSQAIMENRPLVVWVGVFRADIEAARPDALHLRCNSFPAAAAPCVVVGRPRDGELWRIVDLSAVQADRLRPVLRRVCGPRGCSIVSELEF